MIAPRKKRSKAKKHQQRNMWMTYKIKKLSASTKLVRCTNCKKYKLSHRVCPHCGFYAGKQIITIKSKGEAVLEVE